MWYNIFLIEKEHSNSHYVVPQHMDKAGLLPSSITLFMRPAAKEMWDILMSHERILIEGPPGTGKSVLVWVWAYKMATEEQKKIIWMHCNKDSASNVVQLVGKKLKSCRPIKKK